MKEELNTRPKVGDPMALFWVLGYIHASSGYSDNPFHRSDLNSSKIFQCGLNAKRAEKKS